MSQPTLPSPTYAGAFRCIGAACEDTCCRDWSIPVDRQTYQIYQSFPVNKLGSIVAHFVSLKDGAPESLHARIELAPSGFCPFFTPERDCSIQREYGARVLPTTCSVYPRALNMVAGELEGSLHLSCPEAARNVLLNPSSMQVAADLQSGQFRTDNFAVLATHGEGKAYKPYHFYKAVRALLVSLVRDRTRPLWQRLLLIGSLCQRLDGITSPAQDEAVAGVLEDYRHLEQHSGLQAALESMPSDPAVKLNVIFRLTDACIRDSGSAGRFRETFLTFVEGISVPVNDACRDDLERFRLAEESYHQPFFDAFPFILENYLLNYMFRTLFPFGREGSPHFVQQGIFDEYILMATQFAWINGLLIGVSAHYRQAFAAEHVVKVIQSFSRAVEHSPFMTQTIVEYMQQRKLDSLEGMAVMLKQ